MISRRKLLYLSSCVLLSAVGALPSLALAAQEQTDLPAAGTWPLTFTDLAGRTVTIDKPPRTFIDAYYLANFLAIGGRQSLSKLIAIPQEHWQNIRYGEYTVFTRAYPELLRRPSIGGYHEAMLNAEKILALHPDVLFIGRPQVAANGPRLEQFEKAGIHVVALDYHSMKLAHHIQSTRILGRLLGRDAVAAEQCNAYRQALTMVTERIAALPESEKHRSCYVEIGNHGLATYGNSYNDSILWGAILKNIAADNIGKNMRDPNGTLDREFVVAHNPKMIVIGGSIWENSAKSDQMMMGFTVPRDVARARLAAFKNRPLWAGLDAVKNNDLYAVDHGSLRCMMDCYLTVFLAKIFYPQAFADQDPEKDIYAFYRRYLPELDPAGTFTLSLKD